VVQLYGKRGRGVHAVLDQKSAEKRRREGKVVVYPFNLINFIVIIFKHMKGLHFQGKISKETKK
jgi:hypothetical protein